MIVDCDMRKWTDRPHWRFNCEVLGQDRFGTWLGTCPGTTYTGPRGIGAWKHNFVILIPQDEWWIASWNDELQPEIDIYVDITTVPRWTSETAVTAIDLDLDVIRFRDGRVELDDEDEFAEHQKLYSYPVDVIERALQTSLEVMDAVTQRREPFGEVGRTWLQIFTKR